MLGKILGALLVGWILAQFGVREVFLEIHPTLGTSYYGVWIALGLTAFFLGSD